MKSYNARFVILSFIILSFIILTRTEFFCQKHRFMFNWEYSDYARLTSLFISQLIMYILAYNILLRRKI